jgi:hypothetical protein
MPNAILANVFAEGAKAYTGEKFREEDRQRSRLENRTAIQRQDAENRLATSQAVAQNDPDLLQQEVELMKREQQEGLNKFAVRDSDDAFRAYNTDGNTKHLLRAVRENPTLKDMHGDIVAIDKLNFEDDANLLAKHGIDLTSGEFDLEAIRHRFVKTTMADGTRELTDLQGLMIKSGYTKRVNQEELETALLKSQIRKNIEGPKGVDPTIQRSAEYLAGQGHGTEKEISGKLYRKDIGGVTPGKQDLADQAEQNLEGMFEVAATDTTPAQDFFTTDFTIPANRNKAARHIRRLESLGDVELKAADRADLKDINVLIASGKTVADELTPEATGILDNFTAGIRKYMSDESVPDTQARAAYSAYRNALLRSFGGTAMSDSEVKNFNAAFGTLAQKYPAVISQFKQAITQTKAKLDTVAQLNDPYIAHYYLGKSQDDIDIISTRLDRTLDELNGIVAPEQAAATQSWKADWANK